MGVIGIVGAFVVGMFGDGATGFNVWSLLVAVLGAIILACRVPAGGEQDGLAYP